MEVYINSCFTETLGSVYANPRQQDGSVTNAELAATALATLLTQDVRSVCVLRTVYQKVILTAPMGVRARSMFREPAATNAKQITLIYQGRTLRVVRHVTVMTVA